MKKFFLLTILISTIINAQSFNLLLSPDIKETMKDIFFINSTTGWMCGTKGAIYKTTNGGDNWIQQYSDSLRELSKIFFIDQNTGWIVSNNSSVYKTTNGGANWTEYNFAGAIPNVILTFSDAILFKDFNNGFLTAGKGATSYTLSYLLKSTDGGVTWVKKDSLVSTSLKRRWYDLDMNGNDGVVVGDQKNIQKYSTNFGETWTLSTAINDPYFYMLKYVHFLNSTDVITLGEGNEFYSTPTPIYKSTDKGINWVKKNLTFSNKYDRVKDVYFKDGLNGIAVGSNGFTRTYIISTSDAGENWNYSTVNYSFGLQSISGVGDNLFVLGTSTHILKSTNFGNSWQQVKLFTPSSIGGMQFIGGRGYAFTRNGDFYLSTNNGRKWIYHSNAGKNNSGAMQFLNSSNGFILKENRHIIKTTDGGESWRTVLSPVDENARNLNGGISFGDNNTGYAWMSLYDYGNHYIYKTTNGGESWDSLANFSVSYISGDVVAFDANNVVFCGPGRWVRRTTNGGATWDSASFVNFPESIGKKDFEDLCKISNTKAVGVGYGYICTTTDKGATWNYINHGFALDDSSFYVVAFANEQIGYVGCYYGGILKTTNGGTTWSYDSTYKNKYYLYSAAFNENNKMFFGTSSGEIIGEENPAAINENSITPNQCILYQNYPNPFNPVTTIKYKLEKKDATTLKIFDPLAKEIKTLINETQNSGEYEIVLNSKELNLTSGVYFYQLVSGKNILTRKFILLK